MDSARLGNLWRWFTGAGSDWALLWVGLATLTFGLILLTRTRWGQSRAIEKCVALSSLAHILLAWMATTVQFVATMPSAPSDTIEIAMIVADDPADRQPETDSTSPRWERFVAESTPNLAAVEPSRAKLDQTWAPEHSEVVAASAFEPSLPDVEPAPPQAVDSLPESLAPSHGPRAAEALAVPKPQRRDSVAPIAPNVASPDRAVAGLTDPIARSPLDVPSPSRTDLPAPQLDALPRPTDHAEALASDADVAARAVESARGAAGGLASGANSPAASGGSSTAAASGSASAPDEVSPAIVRSGAAPPPLYRLRFTPDRLAQARPHGATMQSETSVADALKWLAANQEADGRWNVRNLGAGRETFTLGHDRKGAGAQAETGISALALLAFMGSGNTHWHGEYADNVRRGLQFLLRSQAANGSLAGDAEFFARMYCHGMAAFALGEAFALTSDERLKPSIDAAVAYSVRTQIPASGGWRYQPGDAVGDMSQFGWQIMGLRSAAVAGVPHPDETRRLAVRFLNSCSSGNYGGLSGYRPGEAASRTMTAEALACRQFLSLPLDKRTVDEATSYLLEQLPGQGEADFYYWYYATLALRQAEGPAWPTWNRALQRTLAARQKTAGALAGSWDSDTRWGGYGGRAYSTAMAALCLESYYRYLPSTAAYAIPVVR